MHLHEPNLSRNSSASPFEGLPRHHYAAILLSFVLQHGADIEAIRKALCRDSQGRALGPVAAALDLLIEGKIAP